MLWRNPGRFPVEHAYSCTPYFCNSLNYITDSNSLSFNCNWIIEFQTRIRSCCSIFISVTIAVCKGICNFHYHYFLVVEICNLSENNIKLLNIPVKIRIVGNTKNIVVYLVFFEHGRLAFKIVFCKWIRIVNCNLYVPVKITNCP